MARSKGSSSPTKSVYMYKKAPNVTVTATALGMCVMGSQIKDNNDDLNEKDCFFKLGYYLVLAGTCSVSLGVFNSLAPSVLDIMEEYWPKKYTARNRMVKLFKIIGNILFYVQVLFLCFGLFFVWSQFPFWQHTDPKKPNYCVYGPMMFTLIYTVILWIFMIFVIAVWSYVNIQHYYIKHQK